MTKQPISERRLAANRANAQKSTGPRTAEGKRRVAKNACRHNLYSKLHHLPEEVADLLYRQALEETADIADPRFRALFVHRFLLRGHERRLLQLEGKLWAEALRVNNGIIPYASLWIRENHAEVVQALGRYHSWICVRIRAIQKSIFPYVIGDVVNQTGIPARTYALLASAAGSSRPIVLTAQAGSTPGAEVGREEAALPSGTLGLAPPSSGRPFLFGAKGGFRAVRPVPAPQAVKAIRPPTVPGLSLRFLKRKPTPAPKGESSTKNHDRQGVVPTIGTAHVSKRATEAQSTLPEATNPSPQSSSSGIAEAIPPVSQPIPNRPSQSTPPERSNPTQGSRSANLLSARPNRHSLWHKLHPPKANPPTNHDRKGVVHPLRTATGKERATEPQSTRPEATNPSHQPSLNRIAGSRHNRPPPPPS